MGDNERILISKATNQDLHDIVEFRRDRSATTDYVSFTSYENEYTTLYSCSNAHDFYLLAKLNNQIVGNLLFTISRKGDHTGTISRVAVADTHEGRGICTAMFNYCYNHAKKYGIKSIELLVDVENSAALKAYMNFGFIKVRDLVDDEVNYNVMKKYL